MADQIRPNDKTVSREGGTELTLDEIVEAFESACNQFAHVDVAEFLPSPKHPEFESIVTELLCVDFERRFKRDEPKSIDAYREEFAELFANTSLLERMAFEEYRLLASHGEDVLPSKYRARFGIRTNHWPLVDSSPSNLEQLSSVVLADGITSEMHRVASVTPPLPSVGDEFLGFKILEVLSECRFGRVFLARQRELADRRVVIKVTSKLWSESDRLARLQHTNIVPIHSVHQSLGLQAVCMPFLGRRTLADFLKQVKAASAAQATTAGGVVDAWIDGSEKHVASTGRHLVALRSLSYEHLCVWIVARIAAGLAQAHDRGICHRDLKPANVLLTDEFQPLILDFNLSEDVVSGGTGSVLVGGTLPYMAPEQLKAVVTGGHIDERSDLYSLGIILFQLLTGELPLATVDGSILGRLSHLMDSRSKRTPSVRSGLRETGSREHAQFTVDVDSILQRCLAADPKLRYQTAHQLQEDLERHLKSLPLKHAPNRSLVLRTWKWTKRSPRVASASIVALLCVLLLTISSGFFFARGIANAHRATESFERFRELAALATPKLITSAKSELQLEGIEQAKSAISIYQPQQLAWSEQRIVRQLDPANQQRVAGHLQRLHFLLARASLRKARMLTDECERNRVLTMARLDNEVARAVVAQPESAALLLQAAEIATLLEDDEHALAMQAAAKLAPSNDSHSKLMLAIQQVDAFEYEAAKCLLERLATETPQDYFVWLLLGACHDGMREAVHAEACYSACIALWPDNHLGYRFRASARIRSQRYEAAIEDLNKTLTLRPSSKAAFGNRATANIGLGRYEDALRDLSQSIKLGRGDASVYFLRARVNRMLERYAQSEVDLEAAMQRQPGSAQGWVLRALAHRYSDPETALRELERALQIQPRSIKALQNKAALLSKLGRNEEAVAVLTRMIEIAPTNAAAYLARGLLKAKQGNREAALSDGLEGLRQDDSPTSHYQMARIHAAISLAAYDEDSSQAAEHIRIAVGKSPGVAVVMEADPDLAAILDLPEVRSVILTAKLLLESER